MTFFGVARRRSPARNLRYQETVSRRHKPDYVLIVLAVILLSLGMIVMYSLSPILAEISSKQSSYYFSRHVMAFAIGLVGLIWMYNFDTKKLKSFSYLLGIVALVASALILILSGIAYRWVTIAGFSFQPAEMMKFGIVLWLAYYLGHRHKTGLIKQLHGTLKPVLIILFIVAIIIVILQRDLGSMVVLATTVASMLFIGGVPFRPLAIFLLICVVLASMAVISTPYRRDRFQTFLNPERDCQNEGYHACQALIAVGSGGLIGLGIGNSVQAYGYLPETPTDSIFAIYAENFGFIGSALMLVIIGMMISRMLKIASRSQTWESRLIVIGFVTWFGVQSIINIGAMLGLLPLKGITLPFVSYGGSSLIFVMMALGVTLRISCYTSNRKYELNDGQESSYENNTIGRGNRRAYNAPFGSRTRN